MFWKKRVRDDEAVVVDAYDSISKEVAKKVAQELRLYVGEVRDLIDKANQLDKLQKEVTALEIEKSKKLEEYARKEREIEHKVGLERKRQEQEIELAKREARVGVEEENLKKDKERFKKELDFQMDRFTKEVTYQRELSEKLLAMLPKMTIKQELE